ncbi:MAG TPA: AraC family transcriptional regulator [Polyangia bacterium]
MSDDTLSEVLRAVRLTGAVFFEVDAGTPWVAEAPHARKIGPFLLPGVEHVIEYHVVTSGSCWAGIVDETPVRLSAGDIIVFPQGDPHVVSSAPGMRGDPDSDVIRSAGTGHLPISMKVGGDGERTEVLCGFLGCDARPFNPLLSTLPRLLHVPRRDPGDDVLVGLVRRAVAESTARRAGSDAVLSRLSELLFLEVVRRYIADLPVDQKGWLAGLRDDSVGRALALLHERPAHDWSLDSLARAVGVSRSVMAERFAEFVGVPPMQYLAQWRMQLCASLLASTTLGLAEIAERVGYGSEAALSRAYKRLVGVAPADWRRGRRERTDTGAPA